MSNPCERCGCMLEDNLGCPEMKHCYDYHAHNYPGFVRSLDVLNPLVEEMIRIRRLDNYDRVNKLIREAYSKFYPLVPAQTKYASEIDKFFNNIKRDSEILMENRNRHMKRLMFDV